MSIKIITGALHEDAQGNIQLRGVISPESLAELKVGSYQREILSHTKIEALSAAIEKGKVPDIELGVRGADYTNRDNTYYIKADTYIIDGLQRVTAAGHLMRTVKDAHPELGAKLHFNSTEQWERQQFRILNAERTKLSPNVLLRNYAPDSAVIHMIYGLSKDPTFVLGHKITWTQYMRKNELITGVTFTKVIGFLHSFVLPGLQSLSNVGNMVEKEDKLMHITGRETLRENTKTFFNIIDQCWGIKQIAFRESAQVLRFNFLSSLATLLAMHPVFWRGDNGYRLFMDKDNIRKLAGFPISDPTISTLISTGTRGAGMKMLLNMMIDHINSGRRKNRLRTRDVNLDESCEDEVQEAAQ